MGIAIEVVQSLDKTGDQLVSRFPEDGEADLKLGAQVIVRESQCAVFYRGGKALDTFGPGRHTLTTANVPLLKSVMSIPFGGNTPFKAEVYFVNLRVFPNQKWGTKEPILYRDTELAMVRLRAFGSMSFRVEESQLFINKIVGSQAGYTASKINEFLRDIAVARLADFLGETLKTIFDLAKYYDEIAAGTKARVKDDFAKYGLVLEDFLINGISPPEEVQKRIDERTGMAAMGDLDQYMKYKAAQAMHDAAQQSGGGAGASMGAGVGLGMGMMMPGMMAQAISAQPMAAPPKGAGAPAGAVPVAPVGASVACPACNHPNAPGSKFCAECGQKIVAGPAKCPACGNAVEPDVKFCANCGRKLA